MEMRPRDEYKEQQIRQKAIEMIVAEGLDGFGINKLAKAAGVSPATIYIYHKDKEELISSLCVSVAEKMMAFSLQNFSPDMDFADGLRVQWRNRLKYFIQCPLDMEFIEIMRYTHFYEKVTAMLTVNFSEILGAFMRNAEGKKQLIPLPFEVYWAVAYAPLYQLIKFHNQGNSYVNSSFMLNDKLMEQTLGLVLKALKP
ncbi:DNA-binding transcriptional regulator, AcrR family [Mucilaginibacter gossypiicola]|uniref:DNA-binding transcriptional regulator, AcrR family n=1 Tax=Mucilaginibacter gossypiicola TaxID=551995 RepID=A0A1H8HIB2_9SPHI|nr:TetR/AcrR family transcriptional regulator [Mucilaginibacter gossypiicola]SEN55835.1 DNA-binding transcriptional regulator, AcrR family [Mucilaginibacter gossypiicola]